MADKKVYWDSCVWIGLINEEPGKFDICSHYLESAKKGEIEIWSSTVTLAEVFKKKCGIVTIAIDPAKDEDFERYLEQDFVVDVQVDRDVGIHARRLLRKHPELKKPMDAVHLASALLNNVDEFHTFDDENLLPLNGKVLRRDGKPLHILKPSIPIGTQIPLAMETTQEKTNDSSQPAQSDIASTTTAGSDGGGRVEANAQHSANSAQAEGGKA